MNNARQPSPLCSPGFICLILVLATLAVYFPVRNYGFVDYDDPDYFSNNPHVLTGLTWPNVQWAFTSGEHANWHPLTWLSLMLDASLFGAGAAAPHLINVLLHAANSILLFLLFRRMTGAIWRSAAIAMLFAIHPLHVQSVAWISERKDVLSGFFGLAALLCYVEFAKRRSLLPAEKTSSRWVYYGLTLLFFACSLMSKPMLVTLPCVLLLLDFWPLGRMPLEPEEHPSTEHREVQRRRMLQGLIVEKIPFFLITAAVSVVTFIVQRNGYAVIPLSVLPFNARVGNAFVSYARYLGKIFCPANLAAIYPYPGYWPGVVVLLAVVLFAVICAAAAGLRKKFPWLLTGWFWFAGMLVPVIGLVQVGEQAMADRYVYLPMVGVLLITVWAVAEICRLLHPPRPLVLSVSLMVFIACGWCAQNQVRTWKDDETLFGHTLAVTKDNYIAELDMGFWYTKTRNFKEALRYYAEAQRTAPDDPTALYNVGNAFARLGDWDQAIHNYRRALQLQPDQADVMDNLGFALAQSKHLPEAIQLFEAAIKLRPNLADAHNNLGTILFIQRNYLAAARQFYDAVQNAPYNSQFLVNLGDTLGLLGKAPAAAECYQRALQLDPDNKIVRAKLQALGPQPSE